MIVKETITRLIGIRRCLTECIELFQKDKTKIVSKLKVIYNDGYSKGEEEVEANVFILQRIFKVKDVDLIKFQGYDKEQILSIWETLKVR